MTAAARIVGRAGGDGALRHNGETMKVDIPAVGELRCDPAEIVEQQSIAAVVPAIRLRIAPDGTIWVSRYGPRREPTPTDILALDGTYLEATLMNPRIFGIGRIAAVRSIRRYSVHRMPLPQITWQQVQQLPEDGNRYEAIGGELYVTPAPSVRHQRISWRLQRALAELLMDGGYGEVLDAPLGVRFPDTGEGAQPDILFVSNARREIVGEAELHGAPDLVVEILSPSTAARDRSIKLELYRRQGVAEYWIVDPDAEAIEVWRFGEDPELEKYTNRPRRDRVPVRTGAGAAVEIIGEIRVDDIFRES